MVDDGACEVEEEAVEDVVAVETRNASGLVEGTSELELRVEIRLLLDGPDTMSSK